MTTLTCRCFRTCGCPCFTTENLAKPTSTPSARAKKQVSGQALHIREGVVVRPHLDRRAEDGEWLKLKVINPAYKETGEEFN